MANHYGKHVRTGQHVMLCLQPRELLLLNAALQSQALGIQQSASALASLLRTAKLMLGLCIIRESVTSGGELPGRL